MNVYQAFSAVQKEMSEQGISKDQKNQQQKYAYRGIDDVYNTLGPILAKHGLVIVPRVMDSKQTPLNKGTHWKAVVEYNVFGPDGDRMEPTPIAHGECIDYGDKGLNKACSAAYKYWVLSAFCVPLEGQEEADSTAPEYEQNNLIAGYNAPNPPTEMTPDQSKEILGLCMQTNSNVDQLVAHMGRNTLRECSYETAKQLLEQKLSKMNREYAEEQAQTAQSINKGELV